MFQNFDFSKMGDMLSQAQQKAQELEQELENKEFCVKSGGGLISVKANGKSQILDITIDDSLLEDKESMQILLISAINDVIKMGEDDKKASAAKMLNGFSGLGL